MAFQQIFANGEDGIDARTLISFFANPSIKDRDLTAPPGGEANGDAYIVGASATGDWAGQDGNFAIYLTNETGYIFFAPVEGISCWVDDEDIRINYDGTNWEEIPTINSSGQLITVADTYFRSGTNTFGWQGVQRANVDFYGDATGSANGGLFRIHTADDWDDTYTFFDFRVNQDYMMFGESTTAGSGFEYRPASTLFNFKDNKVYTGILNVNYQASGATADTDGDDLIVENAGDVGMSILGGTTSNCTINFGDSGDANIGYITYDNNDNSLRIGTNTGQGLLIDSTQRLCTNTTSTTAPGGESGSLHIRTGTYTYPTFGGAEDDLTVANNGNCGIAVLSTDTTIAGVYFGDESAATRGWCRYHNNTEKLELGTNAATRWYMDSTGLVQRATTAGITASATQTQGQQALTANINEVSTVGTTDDVVTLPAAIAGLEIRIINNGANQLQIYPASGDAIDGGSVDASVTLAAGSKATYVAYDATNWESF